MLGNNKAVHMLEVARLCYKLAYQKGMSEEDCKLDFIIGWNHDIGYAFGDRGSHPKIGAELITLLNKKSNIGKAIYSINNHGNPEIEQNSEFLKILNFADLQVDVMGNNIGIEERLNDIGRRYGFNSVPYINAKKLANKLI